MNLFINKKLVANITSSLLLLSLMGVVSSIALGQGSKKVNSQSQSSRGNFKKTSFEVSKSSQFSRVSALKSQGRVRTSTNTYAKPNPNSTNPNSTNKKTNDVLSPTTMASQSIKSDLSVESKTTEDQNNNNGLIYSYNSKYKTSLSLYVAGGSFNSTVEEESASYSEAGLALEVGGRESSSSLRFDLNTKSRITASGALSVKNDFREYRAFYKHSFSEVRNYPAYQRSADFSFFLALGLGALVPETQFQVANSTKTIESQAYLLQAAMAGMSLSFRSGIFFDLFVQGAFAAPYPKGSTASIGIDVGASF